ncbi:MAG: class I SAM-dependent methyltransferase [Methanosarcinales archaeon]
MFRLERDPLRAILEEVRDSWGIRSPEDEEWHARRRRSAGEYEWVLKSLNLERSDTLLDIGCGTGLFINDVSEIARRAIGVDISEAILKRARRNLREKKNVSLIRAAAPLLPFCKPIFNKIVIVHAAFGVLLPNPHLWKIYNEEMMDLSVDVIKTAFNLLAPSGTMVVTLAPGTKEMGERVRNELIPDAMKRASITSENASVIIKIKQLESTYFALAEIKKID